MKKKLSAAQTQALKKRLEALPDGRHARGRRHRQSSILLMAICAVLSGAQSFTAIAEWVQGCTQNQLKRLGARYHREKGRYIGPSEPTIRRICQAAEMEPTEAALNGWLGEREEEAEAIAIDGKTLRGSGSGEKAPEQLLSACVHGSGVTIAQRPVATKSNEIPELRPLLAPLAIEDKVVTADALHTQTDTAKYLVEEKKAHYVFTVKGNQPTLQDDIAALNLEQSQPHYEEFEKGHGRVEERAIWTSTALNDYLQFPHVGQVFCIRRRIQKKFVCHQEWVYGITDLRPEAASPPRLLHLNRGHWGIENRSHYVRDVTFDEDRSQVRTGSGPQLMACLRNFAIGVLRLVKQASNIASTVREIARRPHLALQALGL